MEPQGLSLTLNYPGTIKPKIILVGEVEHPGLVSPLQLCLKEEVFLIPLY